MDSKKKLEAFKKTCEQVKARIEKMNAQYKEMANKHRRQPKFQIGDFVWIHLRKERFPSKRKNKPMLRADGPFRVPDVVNESACKIELPRDYGGVIATFNVGDLSPYFDDGNLWKNSFEEGENDTSQGGKSKSSLGDEPICLIIEAFKF